MRLPSAASDADAAGTHTGHSILYSLTFDYSMCTCAQDRVHMFNHMHTYQTPATTAKGYSQPPQSPRNNLKLDDRDLSFRHDPGLPIAYPAFFKLSEPQDSRN